MFVTWTFAVVLYLAAAVLSAGLLWRVFKYSSIPSPNLIAVAPVPRTRTGVLFRVARETVLFESLFRANKWTWLFGWIFHYALAVVLLRHLYFVTDPIWPWVVSMFKLGDYAAWGMIAALVGLLGRRMFVDRVRYISSPSDYAMLLLLLLIGVTGLLLRHQSHVNVFGVREFMLGLFDLSPKALPEHLILYVHLASVAALAVVFPFSKLIHFPGNFFSPSHNQRYSSSESSRFR